MTLSAGVTWLGRMEGGGNTLAWGERRPAGWLSPGDRPEGVGPGHLHLGCRQTANGAREWPRSCAILFKTKCHVRHFLKGGDMLSSWVKDLLHLFSRSLTGAQVGHLIPRVLRTGKGEKKKRPVLVPAPRPPAPCSHSECSSLSGTCG